MTYHIMLKIIQCALSSLLALQLLMASSLAYSSAAAQTTAVTSQPSTALTQQQLNAIFMHLSAIEQLGAQFTQDKYLSALKRNYQSSGKVAFLRQQGVAWQLQTPVQADIIVSHKKIIQQTANTRNEIALENSPYAGVGGLFLEMMGGNQQQLEANFELISANAVDGQRWIILMQPKTKAFKQLFTQLELSGSEFIEKIVIAEVAGTTTTIRFSEQLTTPQAISDKERALLQLAQ